MLRLHDGEVLFLQVFLETKDDTPPTVALFFSAKRSPQNAAVPMSTIISGPNLGVSMQALCLKWTVFHLNRFAFFSIETTPIGWFTKDVIVDMLRMEKLNIYSGLCRMSTDVVMAIAGLLRAQHLLDNVTTSLHGESKGVRLDTQNLALSIHATS